MKTAITLVMVMVAIFGGIAFFKYSGAADAAAKNKEIYDKGMEYVGTSTITQEQYNQLKQDLGTENINLSDIVVNQIYANGKVNITYDFYSLIPYEYLQSQKPPSSLSWGTNALMISFVLLLVVMGLRIFIKREVAIG
jgi:hypothetical protein